MSISRYTSTSAGALPSAAADDVLEYGEEAIFRNGEGGYYDGSREKGNLYGDFRTQYISGRVRRTGQEDAFTEQYLRDHYDKPSKTYTYFNTVPYSGTFIGAVEATSAASSKKPLKSALPVDISRLIFCIYLF